MNVKNFTRLYCFAALCLFACAAGPRRADRAPTLSLDQVLERYRQAVGTSSRSHVTSVRETGTIETGGLRGTYTIITKSGGKSWREEKLGVFDTFSGTDGKVSWESDGNGNTRVLSPPEEQTLRSDEYVDTESFAHTDRLPGSVSLRPDRERKTGDYILDLAPDGGSATVLFLDPDTFLITKEQHDQDDRTITTTYSDYKPILGRMTATVMRISSGDRKYDIVTRLLDRQANADAPDSLFTAPAAPKNYRWLDPKAHSAEIPLDTSDHSVKLYVGINGFPAYVRFDSGAGGLTIAQGALKPLHVTADGTLEARGYGGSTDIHPIRLDEFVISDGVAFKNLTATAIDLPADYALFDATPDVGLIGWDLLARFVVQLDYANARMTIYDPDT